MSSDMERELQGSGTRVHQSFGGNKDSVMIFLLVVGHPINCGYASILEYGMPGPCIEGLAS